MHLRSRPLREYPTSQPTGRNSSTKARKLTWPSTSRTSGELIFGVRAFPASRWERRTTTCPWSAFRFLEVSTTSLLASCAETIKPMLWDALQWSLAKDGIISSGSLKMSMWGRVRLCRIRAWMLRLPCSKFLAEFFRNQISFKRATGTAPLATMQTVWLPGIHLSLRYSGLCGLSQGTTHKICNGLPRIKNDNTIWR